MADSQAKPVDMPPKSEDAHASAAGPVPPPEEAPDPDSDDLDDLDGKAPMTTV